MTVEELHQIYSPVIPNLKRVEDSWPDYAPLDMMFIATLWLAREYGIPDNLDDYFLPSDGE